MIVRFGSPGISGYPLSRIRYSAEGIANPGLSFSVALRQAAFNYPLFFFDRRFGYLLALPGTTAHTVHDRFIDIDITVPDFQVKAAVRVGTYPCLIENRCALASEIRKRNQISAGAFLAFRKINLFHEVHLPAEIVAKSIHQLTIYLQG
jgi:hypothetical protein